MIPGKELLAQFGIEVLGDGKNQTQVLNKYRHDEATVPYILRKCTHPNWEDNAFVALFCRSMTSWTDASTQHLLLTSSSIIQRVRRAGPLESHVIVCSLATFLNTLQWINVFFQNIFNIFQDTRGPLAQIKINIIKLQPEWNPVRFHVSSHQQTGVCVP